MNTDVMFSKASDEWSTPQSFFDELDREFRFGFDAAASCDNAKCMAFYTSKDDALAHDWFMQCPGWSWWLNPPYSRVGDFIRKASEEAEKGLTIVCLVPARTDTRWWHDYVWDDMENDFRLGVEGRFIRGRLKFGNSLNSAPFPSVVIVFRPV